MKLTKKVALYPNQTMMKVLDNLCDYRRYCWNQGLELWNDLYDQRVEMVPVDLRKKSQQAIRDKNIVFSEEEQELLSIFPSPSQTHAAKDAPDFNRGRNWRTAWGE